MENVKLKERVKKRNDYVKITRRKEGSEYQTFLERRWFL